MVLFLLLAWEFVVVVVEVVGVGVGDCQNDSIVGWFDGSGVPIHCCCSVSSWAWAVSSISFIVEARSVHSSEAASASVLDTSLRDFLKNTRLFSVRFVSSFA